MGCLGHLSHRLDQRRRRYLGREAFDEGPDLDVVEPAERNPLAAFVASERAEQRRERVASAHVHVPIGADHQ